ncbi:hypothetical protein C2845_PM03G25000 [Panicum miliaceum]|uniref:Bifunctional inhibitor/plant lipid transfer protein/seed storage helical domain-containing protein n=1 Tax=Panicum miliaceum TaxID=4540 RepID=A0A3L6T682_PANMI|nr:hypothetical protein C2845_PM03G25000 [Panicum miliaceum]
MASTSTSRRLLSAAALLAVVLLAGAAADATTTTSIVPLSYCASGQAIPRSPVPGCRWYIVSRICGDMMVLMYPPAVFRELCCQQLWAVPAETCWGRHFRDRSRRHPKAVKTHARSRPPEGPRRPSKHRHLKARREETAGSFYERCQKVRSRPG